jgi:sugar phosphate isomerase/epimerase
MRLAASFAAPRNRTAMLRHAICNEIFEKAPFHETAKTVRKLGYEGLEIAPFTLAEDPSSLTADQRRQYRSILQSEGLVFAGLHWLMVSPPGLHVTTPDASLRERSWQHIRHLIDLAADLGDRPVMVFGSPKQRSATGGATPQEATQRYTEGLASVAKQALERGVTILIEALSPDQTDVVTSLAEAVAIAERIGSPAIRTMFDTHNAIAETEPHPVLVDRYFDWIRHVHVNENDGRHPGTGNYDFGSIFEVLLRRGYRGWVSLEAFDFRPGGETIARESIEYLTRIQNRIAAAEAK